MSAQNIRQFADSRGVSVQAIYNRLSKNKIDVKSLIDSESGKLTASGYKTLVQFYPNTESIKQKIVELTARSEEAEKRLETVTAQRDQLLEQVAKLKEQLSAQTHANELLSMQNQMYRQTQITINNLIDKINTPRIAPAENTTAPAPTPTPAPAEAEEERGLFGKLKKKNKKGKKGKR